MNYFEYNIYDIVYDDMISRNIIGAYLGYDKIPEYYINNLELNDVILELAEDLSISIPVGEYNKNNDAYWLNKYLYNDKSGNEKSSMNNNKDSKKITNIIKNAFKKFVR